jgi:hypothetical protein
MRRSEKNLNLFTVAPDLVKEWHPTANGNLTQRTVKIINSKKVWWICNNSHEWMATIKYRINGSGCPLCGKDVEKFLPHDDKTISRKKFSNSYTKKIKRKQSIFLELDSHEPTLGRDFRKANRFKIKSTATVESPSTGHWFYAEMKNFSRGGIYFEVDASIQPGTNIKINLDRPLFQSEPKKFYSIIRWCRKLEADDKMHFSFGIGSKFI